MILKVQNLKCSRRLFIILVSLTMTCFSEKMLVSTICIHGLLSNFIKKSSTDSTGAVFIWKSKFTIGFGNLWKFWVESSCVAREPIRLDILFPSAGAAVAHGLELPRYFKIAWGMPCKNKSMVNLYSDLPNNHAANLIIFLEEKHLHNLIRTYTFINFWYFSFKTWFSPT